MNPVPILFCVVAAAVTCGRPSTAAPIRLHPENPRYFDWRGKATALVSSGEHYGAVLNLDFDFRRYLRALEESGMPYTRVFFGTYVEPAGAFGIERNTLAPVPGRFLAPWARSDEPGYAGGGNRFDLDRFSGRYLARIKDFMTEAARRGVVVELTLFSSTYREAQWAVHPLNPANNIQAIPVPDWKALQTDRTPPGIMARQEAVVRWIVRELNAFDNLIYEIQNEPYGDNYVLGETLNPLLAARELHSNNVRIPSAGSVVWQRRIARVIADEERALPKKHLIAQNVANMRLAVRDSDLVPGVSVINFHYAWPEAVHWNRGYADKLIGYDESGFSGRSDAVYRRQAWAFMLAGGGLFNHLDYSFTVGHETGDDLENDAPGWGSPTLRRQLRILGGFLDGFQLERLREDHTSIVSAPGVHVLMLSEAGQQYAAWMQGRGPTVLSVRLPTGLYSTEWIDPSSGEVVRSGDVRAARGPVSLESPDFEEEVALRILRR